jgi:hypothetical protein
LCGILLAVTLSGCANRGDEEIEISRAIIRSTEFSSAQLLTLSTRAPGDCQDAVALHPEWERWVSLGLAQTMGVVTADGKACQLIPAEQTNREIEMHRHLIRLGDPAASAGMLTVPLAARNLNRILEVSQVERALWEATFEWHWSPTGIGEKLHVSVEPRTGWARLTIDDYGWRVQMMRMLD